MSLSLREYARHRKAARLTGGTHRAVQVAITSGRLSGSLTPDRKRIRSAKLADREWAATTNEDRIPITGPTAVAAPASTSSLQEHRTRREAALADLAEIEVGEKRQELVPVDEARAFMISSFTVVKTRLLGVPSRLGQRDRTATPVQIALVDDLIRAALEELAVGSGEAAMGFLASVLLEGVGDRGAFVEQIVARLHEAAPRHDTDATTLATAKLLVRELLNRDDDDNDDQGEDG